MSEFVDNLEDCQFRLDTYGSGALTIEPPTGSKVGLNILHLVRASDDMLVALKIALSDIAHRAGVDLNNAPLWFATVYSDLFNAIAKAEGRS